MVLPGANVIVQSDVTSTGAATLTTILLPSLLPSTPGKTYVVARNGTSTKLLDIYNGPTSVPHATWQMLPINSMTITAQPWCGNSCFKTVQLAPGSYTFNAFVSGTKTSPITPAKTVAIQAGQIYVIDYIGSATATPANTSVLVLPFAPTSSLSGHF
jgi:hypothetical protein